MGAGIGGVPPEKVKVHTTYLGGGFGRRFELDFIQEALETSKATGAPVKVIWSREDDLRNAQYRPACYHRMQAGLDATGQPVAWTHRIVAPSIMARVFPDTVKNGLDGEAVEGGVEMPYRVPNVHDDYALADTDRKSTRLNSSHLVISYAVFCLKKKKHTTNTNSREERVHPLLVGGK